MDKQLKDKKSRKLSASQEEESGSGSMSFSSQQQLFSVVFAFFKLLKSKDVFEGSLV